MGKLKMPANQLEVLHRQNSPKIFMFSIMILKREYRLMILILLKVLKNASMETEYFTKMFYLKEDESSMQGINQKKKRK